MFIGLDIGSRAAKGIVRASHIMDTGVRPKDVAVTLFEKLLSQCNDTREDISYIVELVTAGCLWFSSIKP